MLICSTTRSLNHRLLWASCPLSPRCRIWRFLKLLLISPHHKEAEAFMLPVWIYKGCNAQKNLSFKLTSAVPVLNLPVWSGLFSWPGLKLRRISELLLVISESSSNSSTIYLFIDCVLELFAELYINSLWCSGWVKLGTLCSSHLVYLIL